MSKKSALIIYLVLSQIVSTIYAQEMYFTNLNAYLKIPSLECYNVMQDSKGYMWICTENGLVKYSKDGRKVFDKSNGLDENGVYFIAENNNEIKLITSGNRLLKIKNDVIVEDNHSNFIKTTNTYATDTGTFNVCYLQNEKANGDLIVNSSHRTYLIKKSTDKVLDLTKNNEYNSDAFLIVDKNNKEDFFIKNLSGNLNEILSNNHVIHIDVFSGLKKKESIFNLMKQPG